MVENLEVLNLQQAIDTLESQRDLLGDQVVDTSLAVLQEKLKLLQIKMKAPGEQLRKFATVVFADVSGFTSICRNNDAENVTGAINTLWRALDTVIIDHGGTVDKHIGDCVMAVWGLDGVREDDPSRAVEAALVMQNAADFISSESDGLIPPFRIRIGIHSGSVFISPVGLNDEYTVMGDTVNVASRLQGHAPLGSVIISQSTWRHVRDDFSFLQQSPVKVKGIKEALDTYLVTGSVARHFSRLNVSVLGVETVMVGRKTELAILIDKYHKAVSSCCTEMITIVGEAGIGKSRLLHEFRQAVETNQDGTVFFNARCTPGMIDIPCSVFRDILRFSFSVKEDDPTTAVFEKLERGMGDILEPPDIHLACHFAGFDMSTSDFINSAEGDSSQALAGRAALLKYFRDTTSNGRTLIYLEDLHWADSVSLELIEQIIREIPNEKLLVLCLTRPPLLERSPNWGRGLPGTLIHLQPLSDTESRSLVEDILSRIKNLPEELSLLIISNADGNPFYVEELIKMLVEEEVISQESWTVNTEALTKKRVPSTLTGVLQARLDTLPRNERTLLQMASVIGRVFWDTTVRDLYGKEDPAEILGMLSSVEHHDLVHRLNRSTFSDAGEYLFKHAILRDVAYETVLLRIRKKYHRLVALWLQRHCGERVSEFASLIADHYESGEDWKNAATWLILSGKSAMGTSAYVEAISRFRRALAVPEEIIDHTVRAQLHLDCGSCLEKLCRYPEAQAEVNEALAMAEKNDITGVAAESLLVLAWMAILTGEFERAEELSVKAFEKAQTCGNRAILARAYMRMADFETYKEYEKVITYYWKAHSIYTEVKSDPGLAITQLNMGNVALTFDRLDEAEDFYLKSLSLYRKLGNRWGIANCLGNLGCVTSARKEFKKACEYYRKSLEASIRIGDREGEAICNLNLGQSSIRLGETLEALEYLHISLRVSSSVGLIPLSVEALKFMSEAYSSSDLEEKEKAALILLVLTNDDVFPDNEKEELSRSLAELKSSFSSEKFKRMIKQAESMDVSSIATHLIKDE